jgi:predicted nucleic acid-binding protein
MTQYTCDKTFYHLLSALARRAREGVITLAERGELVQTFRAHCATQYRIVPTQPQIIDLAAELIQRHPLRAYDAVQLASASIVNQSLIAHGLPPLIFVTADDRLIAAAHREAVAAEHPNLQP